MNPAAAADPRSQWLSSPDALLQVLCCVAYCGHDAHNFSSLTRAFRGDEVLWGCIKDRSGPSGRTALMACSSRGDLVRVRWLLDRAGANVAAQMRFGWTSLLLACAGGHLEIVRELLGQGADVEAREGLDGWTPLMWACFLGHLEIVRELLGHGANVNSAQTGGYRLTPLMRACWSGRLEVARLLLAHHADKAAVCSDTLQTAYNLTHISSAELRALVKP